jgi:hypothetical protein
MLARLSQNARQGASRSTRGLARLSPLPPDEGGDYKQNEQHDACKKDVPKGITHGARMATALRCGVGDYEEHDVHASDRDQSPAVDNHLRSLREFR